MTYTLKTSNRFEKDYKLCIKRSLNIELLKKVILLLEASGKLPITYRPHKLKGDYSGFWECHIQPDWLLIWEQDDEERVIYLTRTGTHSDLF